MTRWLPYLFAIVATVPWLTSTHAHEGFSHLVVAVMTGTAILASSFLLSWACEVAEVDVPKALAVSVLALVAVLPEYAVDATFAWNAAKEPEQAAYAVANMTGGNRLLLGLGWTFLLVLSYFKFKKPSIMLEPDMGADVSILLMATLYAMVPVWRGSLNLVDTAVYATLYVLYLVASARGEEENEDTEEVVGPAQVLAELGTWPRRIGVIALFVFAAAVIFVSAEPFAESLVASGRAWGVDEFVLVQWVAPLASESPEVIVCVLMVLKGHSGTGLRMLVSSNVNQWTLLVGTLGAVYSISKGEASALPIDPRQQTEVLLTAAQCLFALVAVADLEFSMWQGLVLTGLFFVQVAFQHAHAYVGGSYLVLFVGVLLVHKPSRDGVGRSFRTLISMLRGKGPSA